MKRVEKTVFISYRHTNEPWALAIYQNLTSHGYDVFMDFMRLASGDFEAVILGNLRARAHFVVLLTPSALERCDNPGDFLRLEIETALDSRRNIVPLMLEGFNFGTPSIASKLTAKLAVLKQYNGLDVPVGYFPEAMSRLRDRYLNVALEAVLHPPSVVAEQAARQDQRAASNAPPVSEQELAAQQWFERGFDAVDTGEQLRCYTEAIRLKPDFADAYNNRGVTRKALGDMAGAIQDYMEALRLAPQMDEAYNNRATARSLTGDLDGALQDYTEAIRLNPQNALAYYNRGNAYLARGELPAAIGDFTEGIRLKPDDSDSYHNRAIARSTGGDLEGALADYSEAIRLKPGSAETYYGRGKVRKAAGDVDGAINDYGEAIGLKPDYPNAYISRGIARRTAGDIDGALEDYTEAIRLQPDDSAAYYTRGIARMIKGDIDGALQDCTQSICLQPDDPDAFYLRALLWETAENPGAAIADLEAYLKMANGAPATQQAEVKSKIRTLRKKI